MRGVFILSIILFVAQLSFGQNYSAVVINEVGEPFFNVRIMDTINHTYDYTDDRGKFSIEKRDNSVFSFSFSGYESVVLSSAEIKDTIQLLPTSRLLDNVVVSSDKIQPVISKLNCNIIDYKVNFNDIIYLYRYKGKKYIGRYSFGQKPLETYQITGFNPLSLFSDCYGGLHLVTKNETHLITLDNGLKYQRTFTRKEFYSILKPCVAVFDSTIVKSGYSNHNKRYTLGIKKKGEAAFSPFFSSRDKLEEGAAQDLYGEIIATYYSKTDSLDNVIINQVWDGTMRELAIDYEMMVLVGFYDKVLARKTEITSFPDKDQLIVFDQAFDTIHVFNSNGQRMSAQYWPVSGNDELNGDIIRDEFTGQFYLRTNQKGLHQIYSINLKSGITERCYELRTSGFVKQVTIANGWVYFLRAENGFYKLFREHL